MVTLPYHIDFEIHYTLAAVVKSKVALDIQVGNDSPTGSGHSTSAHIVLASSAATRIVVVKSAAVNQIKVVSSAVDTHIEVTSFVGYKAIYNFGHRIVGSH